MNQRTLWAVVSHGLRFATTGQPGPFEWRRALWRVVPFGLLLVLAGCSSTTLLQSNFNANPLNQPPVVTQPVGTVRVDGPSGSVVVVANPSGPNGRWVRISRPDGPSLAALQGNLSTFRGEGFYTFSAHLFIPPGSGVATIQFERFGQLPSEYAGFLHLDFLPDGRVRIDDNPSQVFGSFLHGQPFIVQVTLDIRATAATANIALAGTQASGTRDYTIPAPFLNIARSFGAVRVWQGFPHTGPFNVDALLVTRRND